MHACVSPDISSLCWFASSQQGSSSDRWVAVVSGICRHVENLILSHYTKYYIISRYIMVIYFLLFYCLLTHPMDGKTCYYKSNNRQLQDASWAHVRVRMMSSQTPGSRQRCGQPGTRQAVAGQQLPCFLCIILISPVPSRCGDGPCAAPRTDNNISIAV